MKRYRVSVFRKKMKDAFDYAKEGEDVIIYRNDEIYILKIPTNLGLYKEEFFKDAKV